MKTILVQVESGPAGDARMQCAIDVARAFDGHLTCLQVTPFDAYVLSDPFGGIYAVPELLASLAAGEEASRGAVEARLGGQGLSYDYRHMNGYPPSAIASQARLADLIVLGKPLAGADGRKAMTLMGEVVLGVGTPVLAVPEGANGFDISATAAIGWNGSAEAAAAVRAAVPLLQRASSVTVVTVAEEEAQHSIPRDDVLAYLSRQGVKTTVETLEKGEPNIAEALIGTLSRIGAGCFVMGAYGHNRMREYLFGGVTRRMLSDLPVPLVLAH